MPAAIIKSCPEEAKEALFIDGVRMFYSVASAIYDVDKASWTPETVRRYVEHLYEQGFVCDDDFL